jgi:hypothetical protein
MIQLSRFLVVVAFVSLSSISFALNFVYFAPPACNVSVAPPVVPPIEIATGSEATGRVTVLCGLNTGTYTITVSSTDPSAIITPNSFTITNGVGGGPYTVRFQTLGAQSMSATIVANAGSPAAVGLLDSSRTTFNVVRPASAVPSVSHYGLVFLTSIIFVVARRFTAPLQRNKRHKALA